MSPAACRKFLWNVPVSGSCCNLNLVRRVSDITETEKELTLNTHNCHDSTCRLERLRLNQALKSEVVACAKSTILPLREETVSVHTDSPTDDSVLLRDGNLCRKWSLTLFCICLFECYLRRTLLPIECTDFEILAAVLILLMFNPGFAVLCYID